MTTTVITEPLARATRQQFPLLSVESLTAAALGRGSVRDVSFELAPGRVHGVYAPAGAGASVLTAVLRGELAATRGSVILGALTNPRPFDRRRAGLVVIDSRSDLLPARSIAANVFLGHEPRWCGVLDVETMRADTATVLAALGSSLAPAALVATLTRTEQRLVELARAHASGVRVLVVDEALAEPDHALGGALSVMAREGVAVLRISADIAELATGCDSVSSL